MAAMTKAKGSGTSDRTSSAKSPAVNLADDSGPSAGVLLLGSVALAGHARAMLVSETAKAPEGDFLVDGEDADWDIPEDLDSTRFGGRDWGSDA